MNMIVALWPTIEQVWDAWRLAPIYEVDRVTYAILLSSPDFYPFTNPPPGLSISDSEVGYDMAKNRRIVLSPKD